MYEEESNLKNRSEWLDEKAGFNESGDKVCVDEWEIKCDRQKGRRETEMFIFLALILLFHHEKKISRDREMGGKKFK